MTSYILKVNENNLGVKSLTKNGNFCHVLIKTIKTNQC